MINLNPGDIVIFKAEDNWLSKAIAYLTDSDVCHAAMVYSENSLVEIGANGPVISNTHISDGNGAYILRLNDFPGADPLIRTAQKYLSSDTRYDFPALLLLGWLLVYRKLNPTTKLLTAMEHLYALLNRWLDHMIQYSLLHHTDRAMVCSQFIYQIFEDCGDRYHIRIQNGTLWTSSNSVCLINLLSDTPPTQSAQPVSQVFASDEALITPTREALLSMQVYQSLTEADQQNKTVTEDLSFALSSVTALAGEFLSRLQKLLNILNCKSPIDSLFVTPADILYHSLNTTRLGLLDIKRFH